MKGHILVNNEDYHGLRKLLVKIISEINEVPGYYKLILDFDNIKINNNNIINGTRYDTELDYKNALKNSNSLNDKFAYNFIQHNQNSLIQAN